MHHKVTLKYLISGISAFSVEYASFIALYKLSEALLFSNAASFFFGFLVSFGAQRYWTFHEKNKAYRHRSSHQLFMFVALALVNLTISSVAIALLRSMGIQAFVAKVLVMILIAGWNFLIFKHGIFRKLEG